MSDSPGEQSAPDLAETLQQLGASGRAGLSAAGDAASALRSLIAADLALARSALGRGMVFAGIALVFIATAWLLLMAALVVALSLGLGWSWSWSLLLTAALSIAITAFAAWRALRYFEHTRLEATRRQLAQLGSAAASATTREDAASP